MKCYVNAQPDGCHLSPIPAVSVLCGRYQACKAEFPSLKGKKVLWWEILQRFREGEKVDRKLLAEILDGLLIFFSQDDHPLGKPFLSLGFILAWLQGERLQLLKGWGPKCASPSS